MQRITRPHNSNRSTQTTVWSLIVRILIVILLMVIYQAVFAEIPDHPEQNNGRNFNTLNDIVVPEIVVNEYGLHISFPVPVKYQLILQNRSDYHLNRIYNGFTEEDRNIQIFTGSLPAGLWSLQIHYVAENKNYFFVTEIQMP